MTVLLIATVAAGGCAAADAPAVSERADSAGIEIVQTRGGDRQLDWKFEQLTAISSSDDRAAGAFQPNAYAIKADARGRLYVLDGDGHRILVFDADGRFLRALGRRGGGPGEVAHPIAFAVAADGTTGMWDIGKRKLVRFGPNGEVLPEVALGPGFMGGQIHADGYAYIHDYLGYDPAGGPGTTGLYRVAGEQRAVLVESPGAPTKPIELKSCGMSFSGLPPIFFPSYKWGARASTVAVAHGAAYDIRIFDHGREVRRIRRTLPLRPATAELAARELGEGMKVRTEGGVRTCAPAEVVEQRGFAPYIQSVDQVAVAPGGELWVRRGGVEGEEQPIDLFGADGTYQGTLPRELPFPAAFLAADRIAAVVTDDLDVASIVIYRVER